ncbi:MAG: hypothetical protein KC731_14455 [Myxococcales bacterium]|nr:hypothetical protein [Myxococcales bacterium]
MTRPRAAVFFLLFAASIFACGSNADPPRGVGGASGGGTSQGGGGSGSGGEGQGGEGGMMPACIAAPPPTCDSVEADVYGFAVVDAEPYCLGTVLACSEGPAASPAVVDLGMPPNITATTGYTSQRLVYRTERRAGQAGVGSAMMLWPETVDPTAPLVVVAHGTAGLADDCAPSKLPSGGTTDLVFPYVGNGMPVITIDYAGLGTEGVQGYGEWYDTAQSVLDGARAGLAMLGADRPIVVIGHSQGGGAVFATQALAGSVAPELDLVLAVAHAGGFTTKTTITPTQAALLPLAPINGANGATRAINAVALYATYANLFGERQAPLVFHPDVRDTVVNAIDNQCVYDIVTALATPGPGYLPPDTYGELVEPGFLDAVIACLQMDADACTPEGQAYADHLQAAPPLPDPEGAPLVFLGGENDILYLPKTYACNLAYLETAMVPHEGCFVAGATHGDLVARSARAVLDRILGEPLVCPPEAPLAACP